MRKFLLVLCVISFGLLGSTVMAQSDLPEPERVELTADDDLVLVGDYYASVGTPGDAPAVLLLHMLNSNRGAWNNLVGTLLDSGYHVLAVDIRGHGETGGTRDWVTAVTDTTKWLAWLREQPRVDDARVSTLGASMGTLLAINGCAADAECNTAIALSPVSFPGLDTAASLAEGLSDRSALMMVGNRDGSSPLTARALMADASSRVTLKLYNTAVHGTDLLNPRNNKSALITSQILQWLDTH